MPCALEYIESIRQDLTANDPNWMEDTIWCRWCGKDHMITRAEPQLTLVRVGEDIYGPSGTSRRLSGARKLPSGELCWHENSSPAYWADCAHCGARRVHVHQDMLGHVKPGRSEQGFLVEKCAACHRENAVLPVQGKKAIRTAQLENGRPARQLTIGRM